MKFTLYATALVAVSAMRIETTRDLADEAKDEKVSFEDYLASKKAVDDAVQAYIPKHDAARTEEANLAREIKETNEQEITTQKAQAAANTARLAVFKATLASHKAFEAYMNTMTSDALDYSKA